MHEPGVSHQQPRGPGRDHSCQSCADHKQDLTEASPAEDLREDDLEERHPVAEREIIQTFRLCDALL